MILDSWLDVAAGSSWTYAAVFASAVLDAGIPIVPSETTLVTASALAASGELQLWLILIAAATTSIRGENTRSAVPAPSKSKPRFHQGMRLARRASIGCIGISLGGIA